MKRQTTQHNTTHSKTRQDKTRQDKTGKGMQEAMRLGEAVYD